MKNETNEQVRWVKNAFIARGPSARESAIQARQDSVMASSLRLLSSLDESRQDGVIT